jgi:hypothetical protein
VRSVKEILDCGMSSVYVNENETITVRCKGYDYEAPK